MREIIVIGAARSGTKIMRETLATAFGWGRVPYDIGYVWRAGVDLDHDAFGPDAYNDRTVRDIRSFVQRYGLGRRAVVEKTVGNALRVPAVHRVFPDALYVHLVRDGVDVVESAARQWRAPTDYRYMARKARHFPLKQVPTYGFDHLRDALKRGKTDAVTPSWGPRYEGMDSDIAAEGLEVVCARQWAACVDAATEGFRQVDADVIDVRYENFVLAPEEVLDRVAVRTGIRPDPAGLQRALHSVRSGGNGERAQIDSTVEPRIATVLDPSLAKLGYERVGVQ